MNKIKGFRCTICNTFYPYEGDMFTCPKCGEKGILEIEFDYENIKQSFTKKYLEENKDYSIWRYADLMGVKKDHIKDMLRIGWTPLIKANRLSKFLGIKEMYIKDDGLNPSGSAKDRASGVAVLKALEHNATTIATSSTGNAASSLACHAAHMGLNSVIFVPKRAPIGKLTQISMYGATLICVDGDYKAAFSLSKEAIAKYGWYNRNSALNPFLVEGKKTVAYEIAEQLNFNLTDWVVISVGDGCSIGGVYKGFYDFYKLGLINKIPKILGVQSTGCEPFVIAGNSNMPLKEAEENTIADSIAVGIPRNPIKGLNAVKCSGGVWTSVTDKDIIDAMALLGRLEGVFGEPAGVAGLAGIRKAISENVIKKDESVTFIVTGNGLKDPANAQKAISAPQLMKPDLLIMEKFLKEKGVI